MKTNAPEVKQIARLAFPEYKGRKFSLHVMSGPRGFQTAWDGGTRSEIKAVQLDTDGRGPSKAWPASVACTNPMRPEAHAEFSLVAGWAIVEHQIYCGQDCGITVWVHPSNLNPALSR